MNATDMLVERRQRFRTPTMVVLRLLATYPAAVTGLLLLLPVIGPRHGPAALLAVLSMHLTLAGLPLAAVAWHRDARWLRLALLALVAVMAVRFGGEWGSLPLIAADQRGQALRILSWNLEVGARSGAAAVEGLRDVDADVMALQELTPDAAAAIEADPALVARYPHRALLPEPTVLGNGLLSRFPIISSSRLEAPAGIEARIDVAGTIVTIINAHPLPGRIQMLSGVPLPISFDPATRDEQLQALRNAVDPILDRGERLILIGDFNAAPTEAAYADITRGMQDVHVAVGWGPGWTWRPSRLEGLGMGLLRIDQAHVGPGVTPLASEVDCSMPGDHCRLSVRVTLEKR